MNAALSYTVDAGDRIVEVDGAWDEFALENGAPSLVRANVLARPLFSFVTGLEMQELLRVLLARVRSGAAVSLEFRCDAPDERRYLRLEASLLTHDRVRFVTRVERTETRARQPLIDPAAPRGDGMVVMCSWCRRVQVRAGEWAEVEEAIRRLGLFEKTILPAISHGLCPRCAGQMRRLSPDREGAGR